MRPVVLLLMASLLAAGAVHAASDLVVITNIASGVEKLTHDEVVNIFMGRYRKLPSGMSAFPVDENAQKATFYRVLVGKELPEVQSYWARLVFSGQGSPPRQMDSADEVLETVANNKGAIGYVDKKKVNARVKIVLDLSP